MLEENCLINSIRYRLKHENCRICYRHELIIRLRKRSSFNQVKRILKQIKTFKILLAALSGHFYIKDISYLIPIELDLYDGEIKESEMVRQLSSLELLEMYEPRQSTEGGIPL